MRRELAVRYAEEIARRLHGCNGIVSTPNCQHAAVAVRRAWVFGSTAKGAPFPNDLDILIDCERCGPAKQWKRGMKLSKSALRSIGVRMMPDSQQEFLKWLTRGMRKVSRHLYENEKELPIDVKYLIFPRWDFPDR